MKFDQLVEHNVRLLFKNHAEKELGRLDPGLFFVL